MAIPVEMPKMSDTMEEGVLVAWMAEEGQAVSAGDVIAQVETDKATMDLEVYDDGVLLKRVVAEGAERRADWRAYRGARQGGRGPVVGAQPVPPPATAPRRRLPRPPPPVDRRGGCNRQPEAAAQAGGDGAPTRDAARPLPRRPRQPRRRADASRRRRWRGAWRRTPGSTSRRSSGSGPEGRVVKRDVEVAMGQGSAAAAGAGSGRTGTGCTGRRQPQPPHPRREPTDVRITQMRKMIARRLAQSKFTAPHFYLTVDVDMSRAGEVRQSLNALAETQDLGKVSVNDLLTAACASR